MTESEYYHFTAPSNSGETITPVIDYQLEEATIIEILTIIRRTKTDPDAISFINAIAHSIAHYLTLKNIETEKHSHTEKKKQLIENKKLCDKLLNSFNKMGTSAYRDLDIGLQAIDPPRRHPYAEPWNPDNKPYFKFSVTHPAAEHTLMRIEHFKRELQLISDSVGFLEKEFYLNFKGGRPNQQIRLFLARGVAKAFNDILKIAPTTTQDTEFTNAGPYTLVLSVVLKAVGVDIKDPHKLACDALKQT